MGGKEGFTTGNHEKHQLVTGTPATIVISASYEWSSEDPGKGRVNPGEGLIRAALAAQVLQIGALLACLDKCYGCV